MSTSVIRPIPNDGTCWRRCSIHYFATLIRCRANTRLRMMYRVAHTLAVDPWTPWLTFAQPQRTTRGSHVWKYIFHINIKLTAIYKVPVRAHIEYCVQAWRPYYQKDVDNLEKIQRRANSVMEDLRGMEYEERLRQTRLVTLEARRTRGDIIEVFKIMKRL